MGICLSSTIKSRNLRPENTKTTSNNISPAISETEREEGMILKSPKLKMFSFNELKAATLNFSADKIIGDGGFGFVYKGWIELDNHYSFTASSSPSETIGLDVAVKRLGEKSSQGQHEWLVDIKYLGQLHHPNLVKLIGYCIEDDERLLVYEFMPNGSLDRSLFPGYSDFQPLSWNIRLKIALGAAKGLAFLHNKARVIYRDLNTSNILVDQTYNAKLSDFGFAKDGPTEDKSHLTARTLGSYGYSAPEYTNEGLVLSFEGRLSTKVDVYSYGVVLLELVSGRAAIDRERPSEEQNLVEWAKLHVRRNGKRFRVLDGCIEGENALSGALKAAELAVQCLSTEPGLRPTMDQVVNALELLF